ncbi:MAG: D-alanine--D-alanine ligase [Gammaproteobacteria bacterium]|nr:D-alanine--D-alanine ligase [Gammaproteobacteria bacterium]
MRIGMTYDLRDDYLAAGYGELETAEFDRGDTIDALEAALRSLGHYPERIGNVRQLARRLTDGARWDLVFNIAEGLEGYGREAQVPALLEAFDVPYTFSDPLVASLTLHKAFCKRIVQSFGLPTPAFALIEAAHHVDTVDLPFPLFAKPVAEGTGKGISTASRIESRDELARAVCELLAEFRQPVLVETWLPGREFTVGVLGTGADARVVGSCEIALRASADAEIYSYRNKEHCEELVDYLRVERSPLSIRLETLALDIWRALGCRDAGRVDFRLDAGGEPSFLEVNPLAGLHPGHSDLPIIATLEGMTYSALIGAIVESASRRCPVGESARASAA